MARSKKIKRTKTKKKYSKRKTRSRKNKSLKGGGNVGKLLYLVGPAMGYAVGGPTQAAINAGAALATVAGAQYYYNQHEKNLREKHRDKLISADYISKDGCESKEFQEATLSRWKSKFDNNWTELYKNKPIIVIAAHGLLNYYGDVNDDFYFDIPPETQLISFERSSNTSYSRSAFRYTGHGTYGGLYKVDLVSDIMNTSINPNNENLYFLENDGITRKSPFLYYPYGSEEDFNKGEVSVACQKLYREGDTINNITFDFYDHNGAFTYESRYSPDPSEKTTFSSSKPFQMTGIYVFNTDKPLANFLFHDLQKKRDEFKSSDPSKFLNSNELNLQYLVGLLIDNRPGIRKELPSKNNKFNYKFNLKSGTTTLREVMKIFGEGTYYNISCKNLLGSSEDIKLVREISKTRKKP